MFYEGYVSQVTLNGSYMSYCVEVVLDHKYDAGALIHQSRAVTAKIQVSAEDCLIAGECPAIGNKVVLDERGKLSIYMRLGAILVRENLQGPRGPQGPGIQAPKAPAVEEPVRMITL